ncbi:MAG: DNA translocase FtsK 4TM domain-containing protein [Sorangiineae bacterium]|nr:DNA translocase FtsK 4TM domain-containing protein [Sorangiineae bacterium]
MSVRPFTPRASSQLSEIASESRSQPTEARALIRRGREAAALLLFTAAVFLCLALASLRLDPEDPGVHGADWVGLVGAAVGGFLVQGFGLVAWLAPIELALIGAPLLKHGSPANLGLRVAGDLVVAIVLAALVQVAAPELLVFGRTPSGGNVGLLFGELMRGLFSGAGSLLVGLTIVGLILIGRSSFSFIDGCRRALELMRRVGARLALWSSKLTAAWGEARELRAERREAARAAAAPRIDTKPSDEAIILQLADDEDDHEWIPMESTGTPPLALSSALRRRERDSLTESLLEAAVEPPAGRVASTLPPPPASAGETPCSAVAQALESEPEPERPDEPAEPPAPEPRRAKIEAKEDAGPRIVDTKPHQEVKRDAAPVPRPVRRAGSFALPSPTLLEAAPPAIGELDQQKILEHAERLEKTLADYGVTAKVKDIHPGPTVTTYEVEPEAGTKVSKVANLSDDLALGLSRTVRIIAPIPGKSRIGFELPNDERVPVNLRELIEDKRFAKLAEKAPLPVVLGRDIVGAPFYADLASMPHVIVAGATGAGKSVGLNVMLSSLLFCRSPEELRMLMIDPKVVELAPFDRIPHMLLPVVTDMKQAATALRWAVDEMERRYQLFANAGTKNIVTYNNWVKRVAAGEIPAPHPADVEALSADGTLVSVPAAKEGGDGAQLPGKLPYIVIVVDEFADLMMQQGKDVEASVARLAQKARAAGMHVVLATQRPSVDVITGMIKANFPSRVAFRVAQKVDSRTILDEQGAEVLLGKGDMLVKMNGQTDVRRVQCPFVSEEEVSALTDFLRAQGAPLYHDAILKDPEGDSDSDESDQALDARFDEAVAIVAETQRCSTSWLQRKMTIGYNRAAKIVEMMEKRGMVGPPNGARDREVLLPPPNF